MESLHGYLQVPPDRSQILGRQSWKTRYVAVGCRQNTRRDRHGSQALSRTTSSLVNSVISKSVNRNDTDEVYLSVYKTKEDWEPIQRWLLSDVSDCQVQQVSNRKQGPVLPTLVVTICDNQRKRRSSRAAGFMSSKDSGVKTLWFRTPPDDHHPSLHEWARFITARKSSVSNTVGSPTSPVSPTFFQTPNYERQDHVSRPGSSNRGPHHMHPSAAAAYSTAPLDPCATLCSESPSLRSRRSDLSSPSSNNHSTHRTPYAIPEQHYTTIMPGDILVPGLQGEHQGQIVEGWTSAKGWSSSISSPIKSRDSIGSSQSQPLSPIVDVSSPPAPGETILDRAFQLGQIPGAGSPIPGQEKLSSIARFDALMRESDDKEQRRRQRQEQKDEQNHHQKHKSRQSQQQATRKQDRNLAVKTSFDDDNGPRREKESESDSDECDPSQDLMQNDNMATLMSPSAQRALAFITGGDRHVPDRHSNLNSHRSSVSRTHVRSYDSMAPHYDSAPSSRPHTAHAKTKSRPHPPRAQSTSHPRPTAMTGANHLSTPSMDSVAEHRHSNSSDKLSSLPELTKEVSSASLLPVQSNTSAASSQASSQECIDADFSSSTPRPNMTQLGSGPGRRAEPEVKEKRDGRRVEPEVKERRDGRRVEPEVKDKPHGRRVEPDVKEKRDIRLVEPDAKKTRDGRRIELDIKEKPHGRRIEPDVKEKRDGRRKTIGVGSSKG
ncbi:hypothetical protein E4U09_006716 [Claviceps aff. purpurea]|uniref:PH domain-containing protein n=1 Tax=Claviceps aff. purpurea TaxID=1967640 RepID=A0A9P7QKQ1_9HYPO|nr:hypothetical protein E4U09_006716 [Claviceps aff. purpurea]